MRRARLYGIALLLAGGASLAGCGSQPAASGPGPTAGQHAKGHITPLPTPSGKSSHQLIYGGQAYEGSANLAKYEKTAKAQPKSAQAQIQAGISAYVNGKFSAAIAYYKQAIADDPKNGLPYNNIGNIYYRGMGDPKAAVPYYQKTTQVDPTYVYGWWNLALSESSLGNTAAAKQAVRQGLVHVPKTDPYYKYLKGALAPPAK